MDIDTSQIIREHRESLCLMSRLVLSRSSVTLLDDVVEVKFDVDTDDLLVISRITDEIVDVLSSCYALPVKTSRVAA